MGKGVAQFAERAAAQQGRHEQAVGLQGAAYLHQRAGQVVDRLQREQADGDVELPCAGIQNFMCVETGAGPALREGRDLQAARHLMVGLRALGPIHRPCANLRVTAANRSASPSAAP
jgi:hypothetical protein